MRCYCTPLSTGLRAALHPRIGHLVHFWHASFLLVVYSPLTEGHTTPGVPSSTTLLSLIHHSPVLSHTSLPVHLAFWRGFDMDAIRVDLDKNSEAVSESQIESAASRKRLGESTKAFKRVPDDAKLAAFGGLLKVCVCVLRAICFHALRLIVSNMYTAPH